jgi:hypothetical protein
MVHAILLCDMFCNRLQVIRPSGAVLKLNALHGDGHHGCLLGRVDLSATAGKALVAS